MPKYSFVQICIIHMVNRIKGLSFFTCFLPEYKGVSPFNWWQPSPFFDLDGWGAERRKLTWLNLKILVFLARRCDIKSSLSLEEAYHNVLKPKTCDKARSRRVKCTLNPSLWKKLLHILVILTGWIKIGATCLSSWRSSYKSCKRKKKISCHLLG